MIRNFIVASALMAAIATPVMAEPIVGNWKTQSGETAAITSCGGSYCITVKTGKHAGKSIGKMSGSDGKYSGSITDPSNNKTYSGSASISGNKMNMRGCVLGILCRSQTWSKL